MLHDSLQKKLNRILFGKPLQGKRPT